MAAPASTGFVHKFDIHVNTDEDEERCWISGMACLNNHQLILADSKNFSIKLVDLTVNQVVDKLKLDNYPLDVAAIDETKCAITVPVDQTIRFINVTTEAISLSGKEVHVDGDCRGLCIYGNKMLVTYSCPAKFQILELDGTMLKTVMINSLEYLIFSEPYYVTANNNQIDVADQGQREITRMNWDGEVLGTFATDGCPHGVTMLENDLLFVSGENIYQCNSKNEIGVVVKDLKFPYIIVYCKVNQLLFVSSHKGYYKNDNNVHVLEQV